MFSHMIKKCFFGDKCYCFADFNCFLFKRYCD